jgi:drug/metabolite transporter (DMT)-like permease
MMVLSSFLFATMGVCVKFATAQYGPAEIVCFRSLVGLVLLSALIRWQGGSFRTRVPGMQLWRGLTGVVGFFLWFYAIGRLPLATAMTLNYMSSVWMALFLVGGSVMLGTGRMDWRLIATVLLGFAGVAMVLRPSLDQEQLWGGVVGLLSGVVAATALLQMAALGRVGEPEYRTVFYLSVAGSIGGALIASIGGWSGHTWAGIGWLLAVGLLGTTAQLLLTRAYRLGRPLVNASLQYLGIAFAFVYGALVFDDPVTWMALAGMALIVVAGVAATVLRTGTTAETANTTTDA